MTKGVYITIIIVCLLLFSGCNKQPLVNYSEQTIKKLQKEILNLQNNNSDLLKKIEEVNNEKQGMEEEIKKYSIQYEQDSKSLIGNTCTQDKCLFADESGSAYGIAIIEGYYEQIERSAWGTTKKCDNFTITGGSEELSNFFIDLVVNKRNTVNSINEQGQPMINLYIDKLNQSDREKIKNSNIDTPIKIVVLNPLEYGGSGAPACYSFVEILKVK